MPAVSALKRPVNAVDKSRGPHHGWAGSEWLSVKLFTHPERISEIITDHLPALTAKLAAGGTAPSCWWLRYRSRHENDHLRLRIRVSPDRRTTYANAAGDWAQLLRRTGLAGRLVQDTYYPEIARYGPGPALAAAENVFVADSHVTAAMLLEPPECVSTPARATANMAGIVHAFFGDTGRAMRWLANRPAPAAVALDPTVADEAIWLAHKVITERCPRRWPPYLTDAWQARTAALAAYRQQLPRTYRESALESLLHMHHNRAVGTDPESERLCRRLARSAAVSWHARHYAMDGEAA